MRRNSWLKRISLVVLTALVFQVVGVPVTLAHLVISSRKELSGIVPPGIGQALESAAVAFQDLSPQAWAAPAAAPLGDPLSAPLCHDPGDTNSLYEDEDTCLEGEAAGSSVSYAGRKLTLSHTLGSVGPSLVLRYDSRPQPVPMILSAWVPTLLPIERWEIRIAGWVFRGEGSQPLALWDTTDRDTGELLPAGVYDMEIHYENEMGLGSTFHPVIVQRPESGPLGVNWWHNYDVQLQVLDSERVLLHAFGFDQLFVGRRGVYNCASAPGHTLSQQPDGTWHWLRNGADGAPVRGLTVLSADGRVTRWEEPTGRFLAFAYDDEGHLASIRDEASRETTLSYDRGHLIAITDASGATWDLGYQDDDLALLTDPLGGTYTLAYDAAHRLTAKSDPLGYTTRYAYAEDGQLVEVIDPAGHRVTFATVLNLEPYAAADVAARAPVLGTTVVTYVAADGTETSEHRYAYDAHGRVVQTMRSPDGGSTWYVWKRTWGWGESRGLLLSETDADGLTTDYTYHAGTALVERVTQSPLPAVSYGYRQIGGYWTLVSIGVQGQSALSWRYDSQGRRTGVEHGGLRWYYVYDEGLSPYGQPSAMIWNWNGQGDPEREGDANVIAYRYDPRGLLATTVDPAGGETRYGYDEAGRLISVTDALGRTRSVEYDAAGRVVRQVDPLGGETLYAYDALNRIEAVTDPLGSTTSYAYDHAGRVLDVIDPLGRRTSFVWGSQGELLARIDARGDRITLQNDDLGRPLTVTYPNGEAWRLSYDAAGRVTSLSGQGLTRTYQRDSAGRVLTVADARAGRTSWVTYSYDPSGQISEMSTSTGERTKYAYGSCGELKRIEGPLGKTEYTYEIANQLAPLRVDVRTGPLRTALSYDRLGRVTQVRQYLQGVRDGLDRTVKYGYDAVGNTVAITGPDGTSTYAYDALDRLTGYEDPSGLRTAYAYDAVGNRTSLAVGSSAPVLYAYDAAHQLLSAGETDYAYDRNGRLVSERSAGQTRSYGWDYQGRLVSVTDQSTERLPFPLDTAQGTPVARYRYALTGERVETTRGDGSLEVTQFDGAHAIATLDERGALQQLRQPGARWDEWAALAVPAEDGEALSSLYPVADAQGTVSGAVDASGAQVVQAAYDPWGVPLDRDEGEAASTVPLPGFQGRDYEVDTGLYDVRARWYDPEIGRFISPDPVRAPYVTGSLNGYQFGLNNPLRYNDPTGELVPLIIAAAVIGAAFYASYSGASYAFSTTWECFSGWEMARRIAVGAAIGAAVGAGGYALGLGTGALFGAMGLSSAAAGIAGGVVGGAATGAAESFLSQLFLDGRSLGDVDGGDIIRSAVIGALAGGITGGMTHVFEKPAQLVMDFFVSKMGEGLGGSFAQLFLGI